MKRFNYSYRTTFLATVAGALILIMLGVVAGVYRHGARQSGQVIYTSPDHTYSFMHPTDWTVRSTPAGVVITIPYEGASYTARVIHQGRGAPTAREVRRTHTVYTAGPATTDEYMRDGHIVENVIILDRAQVGDSFIGLDVMLPPRNQELFKARIEELMMSVHLL